MPQARSSESPAVRRAVTYARQSRERGDKSAASPEAQRTKALADVERRGWTHVAHFDDLGRSGWDPKVERPGLDAALAAIRDGRADALVVYRLDRLTRRGVVEAVRLVESIRDAGGVLVSATEPEFDLGTPIGAAMFAILSAMAAQESDNISARTTAAKAVLRAAGAYPSGRPPFGHHAERVARDGLTITTLVREPSEAAVLADVVDRALLGASVVSLARDLNARGVTTRSGSPWTTSKLSRALRSPTLAGYMPAMREERSAATPRDERGRIVIATDAEGHLMQPWEPIVEPGVWHRLQDALDSRPVQRGTNRQPSLFGGGSGLLRCAECGGPMVADRARASAAYRCAWHRSGKTRETCTGVSVSLVHAEDYIAVAAFTRLGAVDPSDPDDADLLVTLTERFAGKAVDPESAARRSALTEARAQALSGLNRLDDDRREGLFDGVIGAERYARQVRTLNARAEEADAALQSITDEDAASGFMPWLDALSTVNDPDAGPIGPGSVWDAWDLVERREFLALALDLVEVRKGTHSGGNTPFRGAERLRLVWAGSADKSVKESLHAEPRTAADERLARPWRGTRSRE